MLEILQTKIKEDTLHLWLQSDRHEGNESHDRVTYAKYRDWYFMNRNTKKHNVRTIWLGDIFEFSIPTHIPKATRHQDKTLQEQTSIMEADLQMQRPLLYLAGNHEYRIINSSWMDNPIEVRCKQNKIPYSNTALFWELTINKRKYLFYLSHGLGGQLPDSGFKRLHRDGTTILCDFVVMGHSHHNWHGIKKIFKQHKWQMLVKEQHWIRTGSFLQYPEYITQRSHRPDIIGNPILSFKYGKEPILSTNLERWYDTFG